MAKSKVNPLTDNPWENRIVGWDVVDPDTLLANPKNYRRHPAPQREALRGSLNDLGWIAPVIVNRTSGFVVDGHARIEEAITHHSQVPVAYVELTDKEEAEALFILDPISAMASVDQEALGELLQGIQTEDEWLLALITSMSDSAILTDLLESGNVDAGNLSFEISTTASDPDQRDRARELLQEEGFDVTVRAVRK